MNGADTDSVENLEMVMPQESELNKIQKFLEEENEQKNSTKKRVVSKKHILFNRVSYDGTLASRKATDQVNSGSFPENDFGSPATTQLNFKMVNDSHQLRSSLNELKK